MLSQYLNIPNQYLMHNRLEILVVLHEYDTKPPNDYMFIIIEHTIDIKSEI